jgi:hypothetical protein
MRTITLTDEQVASLRYTLTKRDDWGMSPIEYHTELMDLEHQLQGSEPTCPTCGWPGNR